jgi:hypothetical protein
MKFLMMLIFCSSIHVTPLREIQIPYKTIASFSGVPRNFFGEGGSTNSFEDRGQKERRSGGGSPLVRGFTQFANE